MNNSSQTSLSINDVVQSGWVHQQEKRFVQAYDAYEIALQLAPEHPEVLHLMGLLAHDMGQAEVAIKWMESAIAVNPESSHFYVNLGRVLLSTRSYAEAIGSFEKALALDAENAVYHFNHALALAEYGQFEEAIRSYRAAIDINPLYFEALSNLGNIYLDLNEVEQATQCFQAAVEVAPTLADMHFNLANALSRQRNVDAAIKSFLHAIECDSNFVRAYINLGVELFNKGKLNEAIECYECSLVIDPYLFDAHFNKGNALQIQHKLYGAIESYKTALSIRPIEVEVYCNMGNALRTLGRLSEGVACYQRALELKPDYANAYSNLLFLYSYHGYVSPLEHLRFARQWEHACVPAEIISNARNKKIIPLPLTGRRLKVAYISGDFRKHATCFFIEQVLVCHDRTKVEVFAYSNNTFEDGVTDRIKGLVEHWVPVAGWTDHALCGRIQADGIDVLVDLSGHTSHNRMALFALRAAPVQASYLYFATTGLTEMDYWIGDEHLVPVSIGEQLSEQVWRLPRCWISYKTLQSAPISQWKPSADGSVWLGCFNNLGKITNETIQLWAQILLKLPSAFLILKNKQLADISNCEKVLAEFLALGVSSDRIRLYAGSDWLDYMAMHDKLDIALDPIGGHGGGTSTCDALWMGVPVLHLAGNHAGARFTGALLSAIGHKEWIASTEDEYIQKAINLASAITVRQNLRETQRKDMSQSPLCDAKGLAQALESSYFSWIEKILQ
jgi:protein O-GlcNAc transferase